VVVDDEPALATLVAQYLEREDFAVFQAGTGPEGLAAVRAHNPALVVLDLSLPGLDGIEVARQLRTFSDAYLIMLTARAEEVDKLVGLAVGADDYMTKPFSPRELAARVRALMRRPRLAAPPPTPDARHQVPDAVQPVPPVPSAQPGSPSQPAQFDQPVQPGSPVQPGWPSPLAQFGQPVQSVPPAQSTAEPGAVPESGPGQLALGNLRVDPLGREVFLAGRPVELTRTEFDLLAVLAAHPGRVFTREALLRAVWGDNWVGDPHAVDVHLAHVRRKLGDTAQDQRYIRTVRGVGYRAGGGR
jgi:DNA-binding response OmpR family regulator